MSKLMSRASASSMSEYRVVHLNTARCAEHNFCSNKITTSLYTWWNFLPKILFEEFSKLAYFYFLVMTILQSVPSISNTGGFPTLAPILTLMVFASGVLKIVEDRGRHRSDKMANGSAAHRKQGGSIQESTWIDVKVGDVIKITNHEAIPADVLVLAAHEPDPNVPRGACHVETKGLDGETNLKGKAAPSVLTSRMGATLDAQLRASSQIAGYVECEQPNASTNKFTGNLHLQGESEVTPLTIGNVLLRGSSLRNTEYVLGLVINTGVDTKVMQGARKPPTKLSTLDRQIDDALVIVISLLVTLCVISTIGNVAIDPQFDDAWYVNPVDAEHPIIVFFQNLALLNSFISVMLPFTAQSVKAFHTWFAEQSLALYHDETDTRMRVRTMSLVDEVGIVSHIFSDKTGTLTQNIMQFRKCSVGGVAYGKGTTEMGLARLKRLGLPLPANASKQAEPGPQKVVNFEGPELHAALNGDHGAEQQTLCRDFFLHLALCHTVVAESMGSDKRLSAASPDEAALVAAAAYFGFDFLDRNQEKVQLHDHFAKQDLLYEVLDVLEFTSARRRMSVIVRDCATGAVRLLTKGADTVMLKLLAPGQAAAVSGTEKIMEDHSNDGLRCLVVGQKDLNAADYLDWSAQYRKALSDMAELEKKGADLPNAIDALMDDIETNLLMLGSTAIEDKLQDGVPACIADMGRAGIAVWVLTGDKQETAINIAFACQLIDTTNKIHVISKKTHPAAQDVQRELVEATAAVEAELAAGRASTKHALVIDGESLEVVMRMGAAGELEGCQGDFLRFTQHCTSVVCCRCAPTQKAQVVTLVKFSVQGAVALAIGDGANDVAMIQAADVGVGISGQEGMQAANSADFALAQFRFLRDLMLVQGRNMYRRQTTMVLYVFYKSIMMVLTIFWYMGFSAMSGQKMNLEIAVQAFNVVWTSLPIFAIAIFDRDVSDEMSRTMPQLYHLGIRRYYTSWSVFFRWLCEAFYESLLITLVCIYTLPSSARFGADPGVWYFGAHTITAVILGVNVKLLTCCWQYTRLLVGFVLFECALWWLTSYISTLQFCDEGFSPAPCMYAGFDIFVLGWQGLWQVVQAQAPFWLLVPFLLVSMLIPPVVVDLWRKRFYPEFRDLCIEAEYFNLPVAELQKYEVPMQMRSLPLLKTAPSMSKPSRWGAKSRQSSRGQQNV